MEKRSFSEFSAVACRSTLAAVGRWEDRVRVWLAMKAVLVALPFAVAGWLQRYLDPPMVWAAATGLSAMIAGSLYAYGAYAVNESDRASFRQERDALQSSIDGAKILRLHSRASFLEAECARIALGSSSHGTNDDLKAQWAVVLDQCKGFERSECPSSLDELGLRAAFDLIPRDEVEVPFPEVRLNTPPWSGPTDWYAGMGATTRRLSRIINQQTGRSGELPGQSHAISFS
jgi:hypothetical protein